MARLITVLVFDDFGFLDVVGPTDVFTIANQRAGKTLYRIQVAAVSRQRYIRAESGMRLCVDRDASTVDKTHTLIVTGGDGFRNAMIDAQFVGQVRRLVRVSRRVVSICTGAFVLAEAGLLHNRQATTHWAYAQELQSRYPTIQVVPDELFVNAGKYITAAGIAAGIDLALSLVAADHGVQLARQTSQRMVLYLNRTGGQSQFSERLNPQDLPADDFEQLLAELAGNPSGKLSNTALADRLCISERHLGRLFRERTGTSPARWVERVRVDRVRELLESTSQTLEEITRCVGFGSVDTLRQAFQRIMGMSPGDYRKLHRSPLRG